MSPICCSFCQHANPSEAKFCNECGNTLEVELSDSSYAVGDAYATRLHGQASRPTLEKETSTIERTTTPDDSTSVVRALERFHADLARIRYARSSRKTRRLFVASIVVLSAAGVFAGDQHESARSPTNLSHAMPARFAEAATASQAAQQLRVGSMPVRTDPIAASPRSTSGAIANLPAVSLAPPTATVTSDGTRAPSRSNVTTTAMERPEIRGAQHRAPAGAMAQSVPPEPTSVPVESVPYPIAPARCTQSVAALGLCRGQDIAHAQ